MLAQRMGSWCMFWLGNAIVPCGLEPGSEAEGAFRRKRGTEFRGRGEGWETAVVGATADLVEPSLSVHGWKAQLC